jgi:D-amino peptidase
MKIYISTDLEGTCGIVDWEEATFNTGRGIGYTKHFLTAEVNAAIEGILMEDDGAEITVQDGHYGGYWGPNMIIEDLNPRATLIQGKRMKEIVGIDRSFDLMMEIGAHSMAGTKNGVMNHTIGVNQIMNFWINGTVVGEIGIRAAIAGYYDVPVGMVAGDYWAVEEGKALLGDIEGAAVKKGLNMYTAECLNPAIARPMITEAARAAVAKRTRYKPFKVKTPVEIKIEYANTFFADKAELNSCAQRCGGRVVRFTGDDFMTVFTQSCI